MAPSIHNEGLSVHPRIPTMKKYYEQQQENNVNFQTSDNHLKKSGILSIKTEGKRRVTVCAKVYNNGLDHFVLLGSKSALNNKQKYVILKHTHVALDGDSSIRITPSKDIDGQSLILIPSSNIGSWLEVLSPDLPEKNAIGSPPIRRIPLMAVLQESDEE